MILAEKILKSTPDPVQLQQWMQQQSDVDPVVLSSQLLHLAIKLQCPLPILQFLVGQMNADVNYLMNIFDRREAESIYPVESIIVANNRRRFNQNSNSDDLVISSLLYLIEKGANKISKRYILSILT